MIQCGLLFARISLASCICTHCTYTPHVHTACTHCIYTLHVGLLVYVSCYRVSDSWASRALLGHYTNKSSSRIGLTGKSHIVTVSVPTVILLLVQFRQVCGYSTDKLMQNRGQLLVSLAEQLAEHADTAKSRDALDATLTALQCLEPPPVYRVEVRNLTTCLKRLLWVTSKPMQLHW